MVIGAAVSTIGIAFLGRSFGIAPALRTIRTSGPYALIRHPMYAGILLLMFGYLLGNASVWNAVVLVATVGLMHVRMRREEALLASDEAYRHYATRVRFRLLPPLY
jgi:protein-S-isoprenylcysteine O-methyltransferase Ste14